MKERYRRIPIELIISPAYDELTANARLTLLTLIVSPRQTPPGVYEGTLKPLQYETALPAKKLKAALKELEHAGMIEQVSTGGWWVVETFRAQCCNRDYLRAAIRHLNEKWPDILPKFQEANRSIFGNPKYYPQTGEAPPTDPPQSPTGSEAVAVTETEAVTGSGAGAALKPPPATDSETGSGGRGAGEGGSANASVGALKLLPAPVLSRDTANDKGKDTPSDKGKANFKAQAVKYVRERVESGEWKIDEAVEKLVNIYGFDKDTAYKALSRAQNSARGAEG